jgi:hypothetical protein
MRTLIYIIVLLVGIASARAADEQPATDPAKELIRLRAQVRQLREEIDSLTNLCIKFKNAANEAPAVGLTQTMFDVTEREWMQAGGEPWKKEEGKTFSTAMRDAYGKHTYRIAVEEGKIKKFLKEQ